MTTDDTMTIKLSKFPITPGTRYDFTTTAGVRYRAEHDPGSSTAGEKFLVKVLAPAFAEARASGRDLVVVFDQLYRVSDGFLEAAFGGLAQKFGTKQVQDHLKVHATVDHIEVIDRIAAYLVMGRPWPQPPQVAPHDFPGLTFIWMG